jgi:3-hydroxyisobutyrate dehydrogenase-like beta-hydroxyacid dehydrogenase
MGDRRRIGFIGLGIMGSRMAGTLSRAGHALSVFDVDRGKMEALEVIGAVPGDSPREVAAESDIVFSSLPVPATVKSVYMGQTGFCKGRSRERSSST